MYIILNLASRWAKSDVSMHWHHLTSIQGFSHWCHLSFASFAWLLVWSPFAPLPAFSESLSAVFPGHSVILTLLQSKLWLSNALWDIKAISGCLICILLVSAIPGFCASLMALTMWQVWLPVHFLLLLISLLRTFLSIIYSVPLHLCFMQQPCTLFYSMCTLQTHCTL